MQKKIIKELISDLEKELFRLGYSKSSLNFYKNRWKALLSFAEAKGEDFYSESLGIEFIKEHFKILEQDFESPLSKYDGQKLRAIRMVGDFQLYGAVLRRHCNHKELLDNEYFINIHDNFKRYCINKDYSISTIEHYTKITTRFLDHIISQRIISCQAITLAHINNYIKTLSGYTYKIVEQQLCGLRSFFRYLFQSGLMEEDFSTKIPMVQARKQTKIPSVWTTDNLKKLIAAIDRGSPICKRNYAIILLACRLGLRVSDIKALKFDNLNWEEKELVFVQSKTRTCLSLPITQDVGWAIIDYLKYGRPKVDNPHLFIRHSAPYLPFSRGNHLDKIIIKYMKLAHIPISDNKKAGMHSLRHTLASVLLESNTDLSTIANILGHIDKNSTAVYLKMNIKKLKECAIHFMEDDINE